MDQNEPKWCLHIRFSDGSNPIFYRSLTIKELAKELTEWDQNYKLWPEHMGEKRVTQNFIWVLAQRREPGQEIFKIEEED